MPYMIYPERRDHIKFAHDAIASMLERKFGEAGRGLLPEVQSMINPTSLSTLLGDVAVAASLDEVRERLNALPHDGLY